MSSKRGRPTLHGINIITPTRIKKTRLLLATTAKKGRKSIAEQIFKCSPRTLRRILTLDDPRAKALSQALLEGERLKGEPLAHLICMLIDKRNLLIENNQNTQDVDLRLEQTFRENEELKQYLKCDGRRKISL